MIDNSSFLLDLEESITKSSENGRLNALWHATDVLIAGQYSEEQIWTFGEVIERLARELEVETRAKLSRRLANSKNACLTGSAHQGHGPQAFLLFLIMRGTATIRE